MTGYGRVLTFQHSLEKSIHVICSKRWYQGTHLVSYAAKRPYVALQVVGLVLPDLGACVVRRSRLSVQEASLSDF